MSKILYEGKHFKIEGHQHHALNCSRVKIFGRLTGRELVDEASPKMNEFFEISIENNLKNRIIDFSESLLDANYAQMESLAKKNQHLYEKYPDAKVVIIASKDLTYGELRIYDALRATSDDNIRTVVRTFTEAEEWLSNK